VRDIAWKAQLRLCARFRKLAARALNRNKLVTAIARELAGFVWAIGRQVQPGELITPMTMERRGTLDTK
jgi:transposase